MTKLWPVSAYKLVVLVLSVFDKCFAARIPFWLLPIWKGPNNYVNVVDSAKMGHGIMQRNQIPKILSLDKKVNKL